MTDSLENQYDNENFIDYYEFLGVEMDASNEDIKKKYIDFAKKYHPDQKTGNTEMFQKITKAYEILSNKETRKEYDLYFLKKKYKDLEDEEDTFFSMKDQFKDFITSNQTKKLTEEEINKIYNDLFKPSLPDVKIDSDEASKRLNDINFEREACNIEMTDEQLKNILNEISCNYFY